ncbi:GNAT family N-acetyltransferase [Longimicrobium sp.]|uniref:GNAT family N-acetyltransferase n=1 Tax=Longimicrobium sp. TaxID=2029185 RepID=UPI003B3A4A1F
MTAAPTAPIDIETARLAIRALGAGDEERLQRVFEACADHFSVLTGVPRPVPDAAAQELRSCEQTWGRQVAMLSLIDTGEDIGAVGWWAGNPGPDRALLGMLMIHPSHRRRGLAREALEAVEVWLAGRGIVALRTAFQRRRLAVHPIVRALGFTEMSIRDHQLLGLGGAGVSLWEKPVG